MGCFLIKLFECGYGLILGNVLRCVLLLLLLGVVIVNVKIEGVEYEFFIIEGVYEDVMGIVFNFKKVVFLVDL